jgi:hypothetical protein
MKKPRKHSQRSRGLPFCAGIYSSAFPSPIFATSTISSHRCSTTGTKSSSTPRPQRSSELALRRRSITSEESPLFNTSSSVGTRSWPRRWRSTTNLKKCLRHSNLSLGSSRCREGIEFVPWNRNIHRGPPTMPSRGGHRHRNNRCTWERLTSLKRQYKSFCLLFQSASRPPPGASRHDLACAPACVCRS